MMSDRFETAFEQFVEEKECEKAETLLFSVVRLAFAAGWKAAGGECERMNTGQEQTGFLDVGDCV